MKNTIAEFAHKLIEDYKDKIAIVNISKYRTEKYTYQEIYDSALKLISYFDKQGIVKGDKVIIYYPNSPEWVVILLACAMSGVIAIPIDFNSNRDFVKTISKKTKAKLHFLSYAKNTQDQKDFYVENLFLQIKKYPLAKEKKISEDDILEIVYTSGTTSDPKGVVITNKNIVTNIRAVRELEILDGHHTFLSLIPMSHLFEQNVGCFLPLRYGFTIVYLSSRRSSLIIRAIREQHITTIATVPVFLKSLMDKGQGWKKYVLKHWLRKIKYFVCGGAALDVDIEKYWNDFGITVLQGYGLTETSPIISCNSVHHRKIGSVGKALNNVQTKIVESELLVKGPNVFSGYYENQKKTDEVLQDGWFSTGDIVDIDKEGYLFIKGRKKDMIITSTGLNVYPSDIEHVINNYVKDSVVFDHEDKLYSAVLGEITKQQLAQINSKLQSHQKIAQTISWPDEDFDRTPTLKIKKFKVIEKAKQLLGNQKVSHEKSKDEIIELLRSVSKKQEINEKDKLVNDLGLDSISRVNLVSKIEDKYDIELDENEIDLKTTVGDLRKLIKLNKRRSAMKPGFFATSELLFPIKWALERLTFLVTRMITKTKVTGLDNLNELNGPAIFIANHESAVDGAIMRMFIPRRFKLAFAAADDFIFNGFAYLKRGLLCELAYNAYPFSRTQKFMESIKLTGKFIDKGYSIAIFPEGTRTLDGKMNHFKTGIGILAQSMNVPIVPIKLKGCYELLSADKWLPTKGDTEIVFGKPIEFEKQLSYVEVTEKLEKAVRDL